MTASFTKPRRAYRCALVTGASSGIGEAFATLLAETSDLVLVARTEEKLNAVRETILAARPERRVEIVAADLATPEGLAATARAGEAAAIDLLVNNAGSGALGAVLETDPETLSTVARLNVEAPMRLSRALLPGMIARARTARSAGGSDRAGLIDVASTAAFAPAPNFAAYAASKAFLLSFSEALRDELRSEPIDVLTLCPSATRSEFGARAGFQGGQLPFASDPSQVARAALAGIGRTPTLALGAEGVLLTPAGIGRSVLARLVGAATGRLTRDVP